MKELSSYLGSTRIGRSDIDYEHNRLLYMPIIELLRSTITGIERERCEVVIVYTLNRFTEITRIAGKTMLIYDRYVGQAFSVLTRILYWSPNIETSARAFARMFAEQAIVSGDAPGSLAGTMLFEKTSKYWNLPQSISDVNVASQIRLQEIFVFAHEYCHLIMADNVDFRDSRRRIGNLLMEGPDKNDGDIAQDYAAFSERYPKRSTYKQWRQMKEDDLAFIALHADELRDELACDEFALCIVLLACKMLKIDAQHGFKSVFLAMRNIRTLSYIRRLANPRLGRLGLAAALPVRLLQKRQHLLRTGFGLAAMAYDVEEEFGSIGNELMDLSDLHDRQVDNPLLFSVIPQLQNVRKKLFKKHGTSTFPEISTISRSLGWDPDADELEYTVI